MGSFKLIRSTSARNFRGSETLHLLALLLNLLKHIAEGELKNEGGEEDGPQVQSRNSKIEKTDEEIPLEEFEGAVESIHVSAELVAKLKEVHAALRSATRQATGSKHSPKMAKYDKERCRAGRFLVSKIVNFNRLPTAAEREAAEEMVTEIKPYKKFYREHLDERTEVIHGLIEDASKPEYATCIATLKLEECIAELKKYNHEYELLEEQRNDFFQNKLKSTKVAELQEIAQGLIDDLCDIVNAASILDPSPEAENFIDNTLYFYRKMRQGHKKRGSKEEEEEKPSTDTDKPTTPENPEETPQPDEEETENPEPDDRPVVQ